MDIDHHRQRMLIGSVALLFPIICLILFWVCVQNLIQPTSISVTYHFGSRDVFCGLLFVVGAFLFTYRGWNTVEYWLANFASLCAITVALAPTSINLHWINEFGIPFEENQCLVKTSDICITSSHAFTPYIHQTAAIVLISILFIFCWGFYSRAKDKLKMFPQNKNIRRRSRIYLGCLIAMPLSVMWAAKIYFTKGEVVGDPSLFYVEWVCLWAFAISWLVASKQLPLLSNSKKEEDDIDAQLEQSKGHDKKTTTGIIQ